jgi:hypothetical protein
MYSSRVDSRSDGHRLIDDPKVFKTILFDTLFFVTESRESPGIKKSVLK